MARAAIALLLLVAACGGDDAADDGRPTIVVTTSILGDVVTNLLGGAADIEVVMPPGADPHDFQASAQQAAAMREADLLVANGGGFEHGLEDVVEGAADDGVPVVEAVDDGEDPHFFTDPVRMADAARRILEAAVAEIPSLDADPDADAYLAELDALDADVQAILAAVPEDRRVLVTNHDVFGPFAERYGFEVVGTIIPSASTGDGAAAGELAALAELVVERDVPAIFADTSSPDDLARTLSEEAGDVEVVALHSESLGDEGSGAATYVDLVRTNAERIAGALAP
jgi:zinc/manganese transport system substrate-binding protein